MANLTFSLTERFIINPVLSMRASQPIDPNHPPSLCSKICHRANAEITARCLSAFTSAFAAADCGVHLASGIYKGGYLLLRKWNLPCLSPAPWSTQEIRGHFSQANKFAILTLIGSIAGAAWPDVFKYFQSYPIPNDLDDESWADAPEELLQLVEAVRSGKEQAPFQSLRNYWAKASLENKHWFVKIFSSDKFDLAAVRLELASMVYRHIDKNMRGPELAERKVRWLSGNEIDNRIGTIWERSKILNKGFLFHATSESNLESILKSKKVEVRHEKMYRGAFVSTRPEMGFGPCVLVFRRNIERLSRLEHGFTIDQKTYWAGFSRDIPVTEDSLAYIILNSCCNHENRRQELEAKCLEWTGRKIDVIFLDNAMPKLENVEKLDMGIPIEWPDQGEKVGGPILRHLKAAAAVQVAQVALAPQRVSICTSIAHRVSLLRVLIQRLLRRRVERIQPVEAREEVERTPERIQQAQVRHPPVAQPRRTATRVPLQMAMAYTQ